jgi:hypothetical protein
MVMMDAVIIASNTYKQVDMDKALERITECLDKGHNSFDLDSTVGVFQALKSRFPTIVFEGPEIEMLPGPGVDDDTEYTFVMAEDQKAFEAHEDLR